MLHKFFIVVLLAICTVVTFAKILDGFQLNPSTGEQIRTFRFPADVIVTIVAPSPEAFNPQLPTDLILYALPNGNSTAWTMGKRLQPGDDWHYAIQHIAAQTRFIRKVDSSRNYVTVYLETVYKSWPTWSKNHSLDKYQLLYALVDSIRHIFQNYPHQLVLSGHSGGGNFIFNFIDGQDSIPAYVRRIVFLDSNYNYSPERGHAEKLADWLKDTSDHYLCVLAYNDSLALLDGKPVVSATGGTWYRSRLMQRDLSAFFPFTTLSDTAFTHYRALDGRIQFWLKHNSTRAILHTVQVERNGFIHSLLSGTALEERGYHYFGERAYNSFIY